MAACDKVTKWIQRVTIVAAGGAVPIIFPTTLIAKTQGTNTSAAIGGASDATVLAANTSRKFAQIVNVSGNTMYIAFGVAASALSIPIPNNSVYTIEPNTIGEINEQAVHVFNPTGGPLSVQVYEE